MTFKTITRRFPDLGWAWPSGDLHQLLRAITLEDETEAFAAAQDWLTRNDIDKVGFREHRLLAALAARYGKKLIHHSAYPRIAGLQRMLWTKSRLALREAEPAFQALTNIGCPVILLKGAARIAIEPDAQRARISHDIDILVPPERMADAVSALVRGGWQAATGATPQLLAKQMPTLRSLNFLRGDYGDIDLHQKSYHPAQANAADDAALWQRAKPASFAGQDVLVPSAADRLAIAIAHGGLDAHIHSDWLVDCDAAIRNGAVDWPLFESIITARKLQTPAAISVSYMHQQLGTPIPAPVLTRIIDAAKQAPTSTRLTSLLQAKPRGERSTVTTLARGIAKQIRLAQTPRHPSTKSLWRGRTAYHAAKTTTAKSFDIDIPPLDGLTLGTNATLEIIIECDFPAAARRVELELNTADTHLAQLRYRKLDRKAGARKLVFRGTLPVPTSTLILQSRASRFLRANTSQADIEKFAAVPISLISIRPVT